MSRSHTMATNSTDPSTMESNSKDVSTNSTDFPTIDIEKEYEEIGYLGSGKFANVYRYRHKLTKKEVAVKFFHNPLVDEKEKRRYREEMKTMFSANHKNLLKSIGIGKVGKQHAIVMTLCDSNLKSLMKNRKDFSLPDILFILTEIAEGIQYLHSKEIVHRDINPQNILLKWDKSNDQNIQAMEILLADFGLCRKIQDLRSATMSVVGTLNFMAPEMKRKDSWVEKDDGSTKHETHYGAKVDIYAFGVTAKTLIKFLKNNGEVNTQTKMLEKLIEKCEENEKKRRPTADDIVHDLNEIASGNLENLRIVRSRLSEKKEELRKLERKISILRGGQPEEVDVDIKLVKGYLELRHFREAEPHAQEVVDMLSKTDGPNHIDTLKAKHDLGLCLQGMGKLQKALALQKEVLSDLQGICQEEDPSILKARLSLAETLGRLRRFDEAVSIQTEVLDLAKKSLGDDSLETLSAKQQLAYSLGCLKKFEEAKVLQEEVLAKRTALKGEDDLDILQLKLNLAFTYRKLGKFFKANALQEQVWKKRTELLGEDHAATLNAKEDYSLTLANLKRFPHAVDLMQEVVNKRKEIQGMNHPDTKRAEENLKWVESKQ